MLGGLTVALAQFLAEQLSCELGEEVWDLTVLKTGRTVVWGCRKASVRVDRAFKGSMKGERADSYREGGG